MPIATQIIEKLSQIKKIKSEIRKSNRTLFNRIETFSSQTRSYLFAVILFKLLAFRHSFDMRVHRFFTNLAAKARG
jgi:hypothetical protein